MKLLKGMIISFIIFTFAIIEELLSNGRTENIWNLSLKNYIATLIIVSSNLLINTNFIVYLLPLSIGITTFLLFILFLVLNHYGILFSFNSKASIFPIFSSLIIYLSLVIICFFSIIIDYTFRLINIYFTNSLSSKLILERTKYPRRKSFFGINSKSYTRHSKERKRNSLPIEERSKSYLISSQSPNKLKLNINYQEKSPKQSSNYNNNISKTENKREFTLKIIKKINPE